MTIPNVGNVKFSDLQSEFGGSNPVAISEYYRDPERSPTFLLLNNQTQSATTRPSNSTRNQTVPSSGQVSISNFRGSVEYARYSFAVVAFTASVGGQSPETEVLISSQQIPGMTWDPLWNYNITRVYPYTLRVRGSSDNDPQLYGGDDDGTLIKNPRVVIRTFNNTILYNETIPAYSDNYTYADAAGPGSLFILPEDSSYWIDFYATIDYRPNASAPGTGAILEMNSIIIDVGLD